MKTVLHTVILGISLAGCAQVEGLFDQGAAGSAPGTGQSADIETPPAPRPDESILSGAARTPEAFDTTTEAERRAARADAGTPQAGEVDLGTTIASLGAPGDPGFWLRTPLVDSPAKGRLDYPAKGTSVVVDLIPLDAERGAGSQISLAAMRLLEADLTGLPELRVIRLAQ